MNDTRIRELAREAGIKLMNDEVLALGYLPATQKKFARLIVEETISEMIQQLWNYGIDGSNNPSFYKAIDATKKTLGVE